MVGGLSHAVGKLRDILTRNDTAFGTSVSDVTVNRLDIPGTYSFNTERHRLITNLQSGGTFIRDDTATDRFTDAPGKFQITAAPGEEHLFGSHERLRYVPNYESLFGGASWAENTLQAGQHFAIELSNDAASDGYRYHFEGLTDGYQLTLEQFSGGTLVDSVTIPDDEVPAQFDPTKPSVKRGFVNWYGAGVFRARLSYPQVDDAGNVSKQHNPTIGRTANRDDVATEQINLRIQTRVWCDAGSSEFTINACSLGALIRGNATQVNREKTAIFYNIGGSISQYPTDNVADAFAARIDPARPEVAIQLAPPLFRPLGSGVFMEIAAYAVHENHPDLAVNFADPDDDGTDEGPSPAAQARAQSDVMQYTRNVTSIPTETDIRADGTTGLVPDMRQLTVTTATSSQGSGAGETSGGEQGSVKRNAYDDDVIIFLPRTYPGGNVTTGEIKYLKPLFEQDW